MFFCDDTPVTEVVGKPARDMISLTLLAADSSADAMASAADTSAAASSFAAEVWIERMALEAEEATALRDDWSRRMDEDICCDMNTMLDVAEARALLRKMMVTAGLLT